MAKLSFILCGLCTILFCHVLSAQTQDTTIYQSVEIMPEPPGGMTAMRQWIGANYNYPQAAIDNEESGLLEVKFVVERDGSLTDIQVVRDLGHGTGEEAVRILQRARKWSPGIQNGRPVRVSYRMPIQLSLQ